MNTTTNYGSTPLHFASVNGHIDVARHLTSFPTVNLNATTNDGNTLLYDAAKMCHIDVVRHMTSLPIVDVSIMDTVVLWLHAAASRLYSRP